MTPTPFFEILLLLAAAVFAVGGFQRARTVALLAGAAALGRALGEFDLAQDRVPATALLRQGRRTLALDADIVLQANDVVVLFGAPSDLARVESRLLG